MEPACIAIHGVNFSRDMNLALLLQLVLVLGFAPFDSPDFCSQIVTPTCNTTFSFIDALNGNVRPYLEALVQTPFFRHFKLDLDKLCKFWNSRHFCATRDCAVEVLEPLQYNWTELPAELRPLRLGELSSPLHGLDTCEDLDYCHIDEGHQCVFVDLPENPERFTGYGGEQAHKVWRAVYSENCFPNTNPFSMTHDGQPETCVEKNLFYRLVSGMHALIAVHLLHEYLDPHTGTFGPNLRVFMERVGKFNDRILNIYFNYALVLQALVRLSQAVLLPLVISANSEPFDVESREYGRLLGRIELVLARETLFDTLQLFDPAKVEPGLKLEFRARFRNVSAIMDCVGCDRCRMWGKVQTIGYGTALKVLFEPDAPKFRRIELVALVNTFDRLSKLIAAMSNFKELYGRHLEDVARGKAVHGEYEPPHDKGIEFPFKSFAPPERIVPSPAKRIDFKEDLNEVLREVWDALGFIWRSYVEFPRTVYDYVLYYANGWWNVFLGKAVYVPRPKVPLKEEL